jgi:hypothetical protein
MKILSSLKVHFDFFLKKEKTINPNLKPAHQGPSISYAALAPGFFKQQPPPPVLLLLSPLSLSLSSLASLSRSRAPRSRSRPARPCACSRRAPSDRPRSPSRALDTLAQEVEPRPPHAPERPACTNRDPTSALAATPSPTTISFSTINGLHASVSSSPHSSSPHYEQETAAPLMAMKNSRRVSPFPWPTLSLLSLPYKSDAELFHFLHSVETRRVIPVTRTNPRLKTTQINLCIFKILLI